MNSTIAAQPTASGKGQIYISFDDPSFTDEDRELFASLTDAEFATVKAVVEAEMADVVAEIRARRQ